MMSEEYGVYSAYMMQWAVPGRPGWSRRNIDALLFQDEERRRLDISSASPLHPGLVPFVSIPLGGLVLFCILLIPAVIAPLSSISLRLCSVLPSGSPI